MKKITLPILLLFAIPFCNGQLTKGSIFAGINLNLSSGSTTYAQTLSNVSKDQDIYKNSSLNLGPAVHYFFADQTSASAAVRFYRGKSTHEIVNSKDKATSHSKGMTYELAVRRFFKCSDNFYTYVQLGTAFYHSNSTDDSYNGTTTITTTTTSKYGQTSINLGFGICWQISRRVLFLGDLGILGYDNYTSKYNIDKSGNNYNSYKSSSFNLYLNTGNYPFNLGLAYRISK